MNKRILIGLFVLLLAFTAFYLLKEKNSSISGKIQVTFWTLQMGDFSDYMNGVIREFETQNPNVKIKWIDVPFSEGEKRTLAAILSDNPPDLINLNPDFSSILAQKCALYEIKEKNVADFNKEIIASLKYNDKLYAIPWYATSAITIYNKDLYKKAGGINLPKTYEKLGAIAKNIKAKTGAYAFMPTISENDTMVKILNKFGVDSWGNVSSPQSVEVFDYFKKLYQEDLIPKESITQTQREALEQYMSGKVVFFQSGANFLNMIKENSPEVYKNTDVAPQITGKLGQNDFSLMNLIIPLKSNNKNVALRFALFLTNEDNQLKLAKLTNVIATNKKALKDDFYTKYDENDLMAKARCLSAKQLNKIQPTLKQVRNQKEINLLINNAVQEILINNADTKKTLDALAKKWKAISE